MAMNSSLEDKERIDYVSGFIGSALSATRLYPICFSFCYHFVGATGRYT
jgi:hypothetical protein